MSLLKLNIRGAVGFPDEIGRIIFPIKDTHSLIQAAGYLKHIHGNNNSEHVFFRGESKLYPSLPPTAFRGGTSSRALSNATARVNKAVKHFEKPLSATSSYAHEALLQHYGLKTTWIDVVDNIWVALWFACHKVKSVGTCGEYLHFERRVARKDETGKAYILLVAADAASADSNSPGLYIGDNTELIDLRVAAPSTFLRPHAQHGLLMRLKGNGMQRPADYSSQIKGVLEVDLSDALDWLGDSTALGVHNLFPPPFYDVGYRDLLSANFNADKNVGAIFNVYA